MWRAIIHSELAINNDCFVVISVIEKVVVRKCEEHFGVNQTDVCEKTSSTETRCYCSTNKCNSEPHLRYSHFSVIYAFLGICQLPLSDVTMPSSLLFVF